MEKILYRMDELEKSLNTPDEFKVYIVAINSEERSAEAIKKIQEKNISIKSLLVINYYTDENELIEGIAERFPKYKNVVKMVDVDMYDAFDFANKFKNALDAADIQNSDEIGIDITSFPIPHFFIGLKFLSSFVGNATIHYTEPENYVMNCGIFRSYYSTKGPINTYEIIGFPGIAAKDSATERVLFCLLGFDNDLLPRVIQDSVPDKIVTINGFPSFYPKFKDISLVNNEKILSSSDYADLREKGEDFKKLVYVEASNPFDVINTLENLKQRHKNRIIDIVPIGSKPMALGVCLFAIYNDDIRVVYPFPEEYVKITTKKYNKTWEYIVCFK